ncbi:MAG: Rrf2 family transcriptional regulator [Chloroflexota bacterium]|nr:Rrf2 family transcriptional regulator [Chloroflexota bacterium]
MALREKALFSTRAEYGVRLMLLLARQYGEGPLPLARVAEIEDLPLPYLEQLAAALRRDGLIRSQRGVRGGYELSRPPELINMGQVVRSLEGPIVPMMCAPEDEAHATCVRGEFCSAQLLWTRIRDAVAGVLDSTKLSELAGGVENAPASGALLPLRLVTSKI